MRAICVSYICICVSFGHYVSLYVSGFVVCSIDIVFEQLNRKDLSGNWDRSLNCVQDIYFQKYNR